MKIARSLEEFQELRAQCEDSVGFVPTMGALHDGHLSLMRLAKDHADTVIVSIYVNPTQFAPHEDFDAYPRDVDADLAKLEGLADLVFLPRDEDIYPIGQPERVAPVSLKAAEGLESDFRPHFFGGVAGVVSRLFEIVTPDVAVFGEKDFQQLMVIREMVETEGFDIEVVGAPIARDEHGLALSSRNAYLSEGELEIARMLNQVIYNVAGNPTEAAFEEAQHMLLTAGFDKVDYLEQRWGRVLAAAWLGQTRLIDNCSI
ncbi:MAG: pantoate--beta-alanine ligase [Pseudomonadota bacterium]